MFNLNEKNGTAKILNARFSPWINCPDFILNECISISCIMGEGKIPYE